MKKTWVRRGGFQKAQIWMTAGMNIETHFYIAWRVFCNDISFIQRIWILSLGLFFPFFFFFLLSSQLAVIPEQYETVHCGFLCETKGSVDPIKPKVWWRPRARGRRSIQSLKQTSASSRFCKACRNSSTGSPTRSKGSLCDGLFYSNVIVTLPYV